MLHHMSDNLLDDHHLPDHQAMPYYHLHDDMSDDEIVQHNLSNDKIVQHYMPDDDEAMPHNDLPHHVNLQYILLEPLPAV
ncbi:Hypothetical protein NTJ_12310 [Nesidiocoris tenuis]|uniref:Uncharacterized protein n=1 Tax=Nesidiocoris tenuis TaxID=355587 RepID=A0ABN7B5G0_9HEMI|nr:Hypothetical protein NTJ_12310 [Nesidiocoris tenuis]